MPRRRFTDDRIVRPHEPGDEVMSGCIIFCGKSINLNRMAEQQDFNYSYLWRVFNGARIPSYVYAQKIATYLGMTTVEFFAALDANRAGAQAQE